MVTKTNRGLVPLLMLLAVLFGGCKNPFFASILGSENKSGGSHPRSYTVTFKLNDGTDDNHAVKTITPPATTVAEFPADPSRAGYTFDEWNTQADGTGDAFTASTMVSADITVYATWSPIPPDSHTVTFKLNDGTDTNHDVKTVTPPASTVADFPADPSRTDYIFVAWNTKQDGTGDAFTASTMVSADITVYAKWTPIPPDSHIVTFKLNDGTDTNHDVKTVTSPATTVAEFPADPGRTGYTFDEWNTQADGTGDAFTASTMVSADITIYATWTPKTWTVTFMSNYAPDTILYTKMVTFPATTIPAAEFPADPGRTGYTFDEWNTQADGTGDAFTASTTVSADITVYATWIPIPPQLGVQVTFSGLRDEHITLSDPENILSWAADTRFTINVSEPFSAYRWVLDGAPLAETGSLLTLQAGSLAVKQHYVTVYVTSGGIEYAKRVDFTVAP